MIAHKQQQASLSSQSGFTIVESLVAIIVVAILLAAVAPVIVFSVATRVQAKRIETATDAAKNYIDGLRSGIITAPASPITGTIDEFAISNYDPPAVGSLTCTANSYCSSPADNLYCVSLDGKNCTTTNPSNFVIQAIRYNKGTVTSGGSTTNIVEAAKGYQLGIRVYRADGFAGSIPLKKTRATPPNTDPNPKQPTFAAGLGDRKTPLVEITTEVTKGVKFRDLCDRLKQPTPTPTPTPSSTPTAQSQC
ncbi:hormogonium polysaccharide secretion pseudopilin HpsB [Nostoc sp. UHCC 0702]|nr:hormogonium polysaccharide secretion pseudopilin HpsB [Nostoc sp. UHCC 0702]